MTGVRKYALVAAFEDGRFAPIAVSEVKVARICSEPMACWRRRRALSSLAVGLTRCTCLHAQALQCGVTLLHSYEKAAHYLDWTIGKHGRPAIALLAASSRLLAPPPSSLSCLSTSARAPPLLFPQGTDGVEAARRHG